MKLHWNMFAAVLLLPMLGAVERNVACQAVANAGITAGGHLPEFDVVSIRPNKTGSGSTRISSDDGLLLMENASLVMMIRQAYSLYTASDEQILGLPGWAKTERFDLRAKVSDPDPAVLKDLTQEQRGEMLKAVLQERFKLVAHLEPREMPIYALVVAKGGSKVTSSKADDTYEKGLTGQDGKSRGKGSMDTGRGHVTAQGVPLSSLAAVLTIRLARAVVDRTGLIGDYDISLEWSPDDAATAGTNGTNTAAAAPPLFTAVQQQLGLRLEPSRGMVPVLNVDHIEEPTGN